MPRPLSFLRRMRVVSSRDFARAYKTGTRARGAIVFVVVAPNGLEHTRLGLSVGKAIWKGAVERNRVRRIFREAFRLSYPELPPGFDVVMIPAAPKLRPELEATRAELVVLVRRAVDRRRTEGERRRNEGERRSSSGERPSGAGGPAGEARPESAGR